MIRGSCLCGDVRLLRESQPEVVDVVLGVLDDDPAVRPSYHIFVASKASWCEITDRLPQYATRP